MRTQDSTQHSTDPVNRLVARAKDYGAMVVGILIGMGMVTTIVTVVAVVDCFVTDGTGWGPDVVIPALIVTAALWAGASAIARPQDD